MRNAALFTALGLASIGLGTALATTTPTEMRNVRNSQLDQLGQAKIVGYPGEQHVAYGEDSYPVVYSPQYLAVVAARERAELQRWEQPAINVAAYDQPLQPQRAPAAAHRHSLSDDNAQYGHEPTVAVHRATTSDEPAPPAEAELAEADSAS